MNVGPRECASALWAFALTLLSAIAPARGAEIETRDFAVLVGGRAAGEVHMTIHKKDSGIISVRTDTDIQIAFALIRYKYSFRGLEEWKDNQLLRLDTNTDDNGKRTLVSASAIAGGVKVKVNNVERDLKGSIWTSTFWTLPAAKLHTANPIVLDADTGTDAQTTLKYIATEKLRIAGQEVALNHYRVTGKTTVDLWYDGHDRLVRQEWMEQGHKTIMVLVRIRR